MRPLYIPALTPSTFRREMWQQRSRDSVRIVDIVDYNIAYKIRPVKCKRLYLQTLWLGRWKRSARTVTGNTFRMYLESPLVFLQLSDDQTYRIGRRRPA